ncbi:hypothetical protein FBY08_1302 [Pseudomonas sp. SJZ094]|nr:hypothetical protein FBY08_1302 [Pseudomonas sp. SJZ094]
MEKHLRSIILNVNLLAKISILKLYIKRRGPV